MAHKPKAPRPLEPIARGVLRRGSRVLLCRNMKHGYFYLPGGHVDPGETFAAACEREFREETGLEVAAGTCGLVAEVAFGPPGDRRHELNIVFHVEHAAGFAPEDVPSHEEGIDFQWVEIAALAETDLRPLPILAWLTSPEAESHGNPPFVSVFD